METIWLLVGVVIGMVVGFISKNKSPRPAGTLKVVFDEEDGSCYLFADLNVPPEQVMSAEQAVFNIQSSRQ